MPGSRSALIIERAPLPIVEVQGSAHTVSHVNSAFCRLLGKSKEDLIGKSFADLVHGGDKCVPILDRVYQTGEAATLAQADEFDSASWLYAMWPALDANEQPEAVLIQLAKTANLRQDTAAVNEALLIAGLHQHELTESAEKLNVQLLEEITGRKQGDAARAILATIVESSDDAILSKDLNGTIATWNRGAERLFGYSAEEAIGQPITMLFPPDKLEEEAAILEGIRSGHPVKPYETVRRRKDGTLVDVSLTVSPIADARGQIVGASKIVRDITERKRAQVALRASEERFRVAALAMSNIIWTNNPQGMMEGEQPGWAHFTGQTREEYQGYGWARAVHPDDAQPTIEAWNAAVAEKRLFEFEHRVRRHDGAWCSCSVRAMPVIGDDGEIREWVGVHNDITERKQAADTILRSEENYRLLVEGATGFAIIRLQLDGTVSSWNVGAERILGYRDAEILGAHFSTFFTPEDLAAGKPERELRAAGDLEKGDDDNWLVRKDGSRFWASGATTALRDDAGNLRGFAKIVRDMSNHRAATDQLRALEARKSAILDGALDGIITMDHEGKVVDFNPAAEAMFGIAHAEIVGQGMADRIIPERLRESHYRGMAHYLKSGEGPVLSKRIEVPAQHADGHEFTIELSINRIAGIEPPMFTATLRDITERQRAEEALRASAEFNRKIIESSRDCVKILDLEGRLLSMSEGGQRQLCIPDLAPLLGKSWIGFWDAAADRTAAQEAVLKARAGGSGNFTGVYATPGVPRWWDVVVTPMLDAQGEPEKLLAISREVTERVLSEQASQAAAEELARSSRAKDDFLAALSHELRTPLTPVLMTATALESDPALPAEVRGQVSMIRRNIELEARLIDDLLDLTRITHGKMKIAPVVTDIHQLLDHTAEIVRSEGSGKQVRTFFRLEAARHHAMVDPARFQQVFWNVVKNALKFTPSGGSVTVSTSNDAGGGILVSVEDTGIGISPEGLSHIFNAFEQGDAAGQHRYGGLGLGLAISRAIVEAHDGAIRADSAGVGRGATFTVSLDTVDAPSAPLHESAPQRAPARALRLLVVEDHEATRTVLTRLLTRSGHHITAVTTVRDALAAFAAEHFDAVISDLGLPDGSGLDLMREIQRQRPVPAIALSGYGMEDDLRQTKEAGFSAHLVKPVNVDQLRDLLDRITLPVE